MCIKLYKLPHSIIKTFKKIIQKKSLISFWSYLKLKLSKIKLVSPNLAESLLRVNYNKIEIGSTLPKYDFTINLTQLIFKSSILTLWTNYAKYFVLVYNIQSIFKEKTEFVEH